MKGVIEPDSLDKELIKMLLTFDSLLKKIKKELEMSYPKEGQRRKLK